MSGLSVRLLAAVAVLVSAVLHLWLWLNGVREQGVVGQLFLLNVVAGVVLAVLVVVWRHWLAGFLTAGFGASTLAAFVIAATVGLFGIRTGLDTWYAQGAAAAEVVAVVTGLMLVAGHRRGAVAGSARQRQQP